MNSQHLVSFWGEEEAAAEPGVTGQSYAKVTYPNVLIRFPIVIVLTIGNLTCFQIPPPEHTQKAPDWASKTDTNFFDKMQK